MAMPFVVTIVLAFLLTLAQTEDLNCRIKDGCYVNHCDPFPSSWSEPGSNIDEYLQKKQFPITCEAEKKKSSDDVLRLYASFVDNLQDIKELKQGLQKLTNQVVTLEIKNKNAEKNVQKLTVEVDSLKKKNRNAENDVQKLTIEVDSLKKKNRKAESDARKLEQRVAFLGKKNENDTNEINALRGIIHDLRKKVTYGRYPQTFERPYLRDLDSEKIEQTEGARYAEMECGHSSNCSFSFEMQTCNFDEGHKKVDTNITNLDLPFAKMKCRHSSNCSLTFKLQACNCNESPDKIYSNRTDLEPRYAKIECEHSSNCSFDFEIQTCKNRTEISCPAPRIKCGNIRGSEPFKVGSIISFECNKDYKLSGDSTAICTEDGAWNRPLPKCEVIAVRPNSCPKPYKELEMTCYRQYKGPSTYEQAKRICKQDGGQLANVQSKRVNDFLWDNTFGSHAEYWIGLHTSDFNMLWSSGDAFERAHGVDYDLTNAARNNCGKYFYRYHWTGENTWQIRFDDCDKKARFICEVWKSNAHPYGITVTGQSDVARIEGVYRPVSGLLTYENKSQIYRKENDSKQYLFYDVQPGTKSKYWFIGGYDIALGKPTLTYQARTSSSVVEPDQINTPWMDSRRRRIDITISKTC